MRIAGFSFVRNGFDYGVPFIESIQSVLPICDEFVIAVGDAKDGTREAILAMGSDKIKIIDTTWDMSLREGGKVFAQQTTIALDISKKNFSFRNNLLYYFEKWTGIRPFDFRNHIIIRS